MAFAPKTDDERDRMITRLVDGTLAEADRAAVEEWLRANPEVSRQVERQQRVAHALRTEGPAAPQRLIDATEARVRGAGAAGERDTDRRRARSQGSWRPALALGAFVLVVAVALGATFALKGSASGPTIPAAAKLAFAPSKFSAPGAANEQHLDVSFAGVTYPNYLHQFGAVPVGGRLDRIGGRPALTIFYLLRDGSRLSYTVFSGSPVPLPAGAKRVVYAGVPLELFHSSGLSVVTLVRSGRTCVLAAPTKSAAVLALAAAPIHAESS